MKEREYAYPEKVKIEWRFFHTLLLLLATSITWGLYFYRLFPGDEPFSISKLLSMSGLYIDIVGVTLASLKTPYYGDFWGMEKLETEKERVEKNWFQRGMAIVALGLLLQVMANLL